MDRDFDDFHDDFDHIRQQHADSLDHDQYGDDFDPNNEDFYDLDISPLDHAKSLFYGLGNIARYKGFNRVGEVIPLEDYFDKSGQSVNFPEDDPKDLYHLNNQTILDAAGMPDQPVDPQSFLKRVSTELQAKSVLISHDMPSLLDKMCRLFNYSIQPNSELPRTVKNLVFPAQAGIGKSVSVQVYVSMLVEHASIIVVAKVEEAINYCNYINSLSGDDNYARCYYSVTDKNKDNPIRVDIQKLQNHRCIVITHNMFRRVNGFDDIESFRVYDTKPRSFVCIDEKLSFYDRQKLSYKQLDQLINSAREALFHSNELKVLDNTKNALDALYSLKAFLLEKDDLIVTNDHSIVVGDVLGNKAINDLKAIGEHVTLSDYSMPYKYPLKLVGIKNKDASLRVLKSNGIITQTRLRKVFGASYRSLRSALRIRIKPIDSFYCERFDPPLGNCLSTEERQAFTIDESMFDRELTKREADKIISKTSDLNHQSGLQLATSILRVMLRTRVEELTATLEALGAKKNPSYTQNTLRAINELLGALEYFSLNDFLIYKTNYETSLLATESITNQLGLSVTLDATAQINEYYKLANRFLGHVGFVNAPQIRRYENLTIYKACGFNQSRSAIYRGKKTPELGAIAKSYASFAFSVLENDKDKLLIICHKDFKVALKSQVNDSRVVFTHWGNHVGRNDWSDCNKVMLVGWNYLNQIEHVCAINSCLDSVLLTSRHLDDDLLESFEVSQLADDIVQGLMRSQARIIATDDSDCKPTSFYVFYKDDNKSKKVLDLVESQFPLADLVDWVPTGTSLPKRKGKAQQKADLVIDLLIKKSQGHETYLRKDVETALSINKSTMTRLVASQHFRDELDKHGFVSVDTVPKAHYFLLK